MYLQFMINFKKKPNAPHEDFLILRIIWRDVFFFLFCFFFVIVENMKEKYKLTKANLSPND